MSKEKIQPEVVQTPQLPEILSGDYKYLVVDPYAINLKAEGPIAGDARLSFYSAFIVSVAAEIYRRGIVDEIVLFSDPSFGISFFIPTTGYLMYESLTRMKSKGTTVPAEKVLYFPDKDLNQTSTQLKRLSSFLSREGDPNTEVLYLSWDYQRKN